MVIRNYLIFMFVGLFLFSFVSAADDVVKGKLYDNANILKNDAAVQTYLNQIANETGAVVLIYTLNNLNSDLKTWGNNMGKNMGLGDVGNPKKNILIGYFSDKDVVYVMSKKGGSVKTELKDNVGSLIKDAIDSNDDGKFLDALKVLGEGLGARVDEAKGEKVILYAAAGEELGTIDGEPDIEERKKELDIPDKFCYWQEMTKLYQEKCEFNDVEIQDIFDKKKIYREENTPDWAELNSDGDFCVEVIFDYDGWEKETEILFMSAGGLWNGEKIYINPHINWRESKKTNLLFHEGLHSIQSKLTEDTHLGDSSGFTVFGNMENRVNEIKAKNLLEENCKSWESVKNEILQKYDELLKQIFDDATSEYFDDKRLTDINNDGKIDGQDFDIFDAEVDKQQDILINEEGILRDIYWGICSYSVKIGISDTEFLSKKYREFNQILAERKIELSEDSKKINEDFGEKLIGINLLYFGGNVKDYVGYKLELDPRLSEVQRWWLDKTSPECEIIYTPEKAKGVLDKFLIEEDIGGYWGVQKDLKALLNVYEEDGRRDEIYDALITRLPGLAYDDSQIDLTTAYA